MDWSGLALLALTLTLPVMAAPPMSPAEVGALEDEVAQDGEHLDARARLLEFYFDRKDMGEWGRHELWLVERQPGSELHRFPAGLKGELIERLSVAWRKAVEDPVATADTLRNAAVFFAGVDAQISLELLTRARSADPHNDLVFRLLLDVYLAKRPAEQAAFAERALVALENGEDAALLWVVGRTVQPKSRGQRMMERAKELEPDIAETMDRPKRITMGAGQRGPKLILRVDPDYPEKAREAGIQGDVQFSVVIDATGQVAWLQVVSGHPLLVEAAVAALKKWRYEPTMVDGTAVEVATQVEVPFRLMR